MSTNTKTPGADGLLRSFYTLLFITLGVSVFLSYFVFFIPLNSSFVKEQENYFKNEAKIKASTSDHMILDFISGADSLGSRSAIKQKLADYHSGHASLRELKDFTDAKYREGASVVRNLVGAGRYLPDATMIASWGDWPVDAVPRRDTPGFYLFTSEGRLFALVILAIRDNGNVLGYDACVFAASVLVENQSDIVKTYTVREATSTGGQLPAGACVLPLYQGKYQLVALPDSRIFRDATLKALYFVSLYSFTLFICILVLSYLTFYRFVRRMIDDHVRLNAEAVGLLAEKELILKEVHHRIKNNMNTILSLLSLQSSMIAEPAAVSALEDAGNRIRSMSLLYDKLYRSLDYSELSVNDYLSTLVDEVVANFPNSQVVQVQKDIADFVLDTKRLQPLGIIVNELITNAMKYAFRDRERGLLTVSAQKAHGLITVSIHDDGSGSIDAGNLGDNHSGFGLQLVHALAQQLNGTIRLEQASGIRVVLEFPA